MSQQQRPNQLSGTPGLSPGGSASPSPSGSATQERYQRLAIEYSKARQQVIVLKTGVLEEQKRTAQLTEELNTAKQTLRKREVEADSLGLLNRQLQARVDQLQESLEALRRLQNQHGGGSGSGSGGSSSKHRPGVAGDPVLEEELQRKIEENARLHQELLTREEAAKAAAARQADELSAAEAAAASAKAARDTALNEAAEARRLARAECDRLAAEAAAATAKADAAARALAEARDESAGLRRDAELLSSLLRDSEEAQVARRWSEWTGCHTPNLVRALKSLVDLHLHTEARLRSAGSWTEPASRRLRACVAATRALCSELPTDRPDFATDAQLLALLRLCPQLADRLADLAEPLLAAVAAEHLSPELQSVNADLCRCLTADLPDALRALAGLDKTADSAPPVLSRSQLADSVRRRFADLASACRRLFDACERKANAEAALRVADEIGSGNRACATAAATLLAKADLLAAQVNENSDLIASRLMFSSVTLTSASVNVINARSLSPSPSTSATSATASALPSAAEAEAVKAADLAAAELAALRDELQRKQDQLALMESRLSSQQTRIGQLEKDRERWMLEAQMMSTRLGTKQSSPSPPATTALQQTPPQTPQQQQQQQQSTPTFASIPDDESSSAAVAQLRAAFLETKCAESEAALQRLDSRLMHAQLSAKTANQRLLLALSEAAGLKDAAFQCREELETTRRNYDEQLAAISDHVSELNRQLERKEDEMNSLRVQFSSTVAKKKR